MGPMAPRVEVPCAASRGPLRRESRSLGTKGKPKNVEFWAFIDPSGKISYTTPHYYPKYEIWTMEKKLVNNPFKEFGRCPKENFFLLGMSSQNWILSSSRVWWRKTPCPLPCLSPVLLALQRTPPTIFFLSKHHMCQIAPNQPTKSNRGEYKANSIKFFPQ